MSDFEGVMLSDYLLLKCLSKGGIADVYLGRQTVEGNYEVAVKIFRPGYAQRESFRGYFMTEAEKIGQFNHPNILPFLEFGEGDRLLYTVTPFVATGTLEELLQRVGGKFSAMQALPILQQLCSAVQYAHENDVIHGNIKPSNVFVAADGHMLLSDFGIARSYDDSQQSLTRVGWGSAEYAAPEQSLGVLRRTSDIYTLGVLLFRILTGQPPFSGQTPVEVLLKHVRQPVPSARMFEPSISDAVDGVLRMAMQKRSDDRFASAQEFSDALLAAVTVAPVASPVAKSVSLLTPQFALMSSAVMDGPLTPFPAHVMHTPSAETPLPPEQTTIIRPVKKMSTEATSDITEIRKKSFLEEPDGAGTDIFLSASPIEWSPLEKESTGVQALSASEYLRSMPLVPEVLPAPARSPVSVTTTGSMTPTLPSTPPKKAETQESTRSGPLRKRTVPIIVVMLLLLGLLGALLYSLLLPGGSTDTNGGSPVPTVGLTPVSTSIPRATSKPKGTTTRTATAVSVLPTVHPSLTPTPVATSRPPVPAFTTCSSGAMTLDGADTFQASMQQLTADYSNHCSAAIFTVNASGTKASLDALASGGIGLAYADVASGGRPALVDYQMAAFIYTVIVNSDTQVTSLTVAQLQGIYAGQITNWSQVGGINEPIQIITRSAGSPIRAIFEAYVLKGTQQTAVGTALRGFDSSEAVAQNVATISGAISYIPLSAVGISGTQPVALNGVSAATDTVANGAYSFWSIEHLYSDQSAKGLALSLISFGFTDVAANDFLDAGAVPIKRMTQAALNSHPSGPMI